MVRSQLLGEEETKESGVNDEELGGNCVCMPTRMDGWIANELPRTTWNRQIGHRAAEYSGDSQSSSGVD